MLKKAVPYGRLMEKVEYRKMKIGSKNKNSKRVAGK